MVGSLCFISRSLVPFTSPRSDISVSSPVSTILIRVRSLPGSLRTVLRPLPWTEVPDGGTVCGEVRDVLIPGSLCDGGDVGSWVRGTLVFLRSRVYPPSVRNSDGTRDFYKDFYRKREDPLDQSWCRAGRSTDRGVGSGQGKVRRTGREGPQTQVFWGI